MDFEIKSHAAAFRFHQTLPKDSNETQKRKSAGELITQIYIGIEANYIERSTGMQWIDETKQIAAMLGALITKHRKPSSL